MKAHDPTRAIVDGAKPDAAVIAGSARMPAPTVVPVTKAIEDQISERDGCSGGGGDEGLPFVAAVTEMSFQELLVSPNREADGTES